MDTSSLWTLCSDETDKKVTSTKGETAYLLPVDYSPELVEQVLAEASEWQIELQRYYEYEYGHGSVGYDNSSTYKDITADDIIVKDGHFAGVFYDGSYALTTQEPNYLYRILFYRRSETWDHHDLDRKQIDSYYFFRRKDRA